MEKWASISLQELQEGSLERWCEELIKSGIPAVTPPGLQALSFPYSHLSQALDLLGLRKEELEEEEIENMIFLKKKPNYQNLFTKLYATQVKENRVHLEDELRNLRNRIQSLISELAQAVSQEKKLLKELDNLAKLEKEVEKEAMETFEQLQKIDGIKKLEIENSELVVETDKICINHKGKEHYVGRFQIRIDLEKKMIRIFNLNRRLACGHHHPHVESDGIPCWGNIAVAVAKLLGDYNLPVLLSLIIQFLRSYDPGGAYHEIKDWS